MTDYRDLDDLGLYLAFIKSVSIDYSERTVTVFMAKPYDTQESKRTYVETELVLQDVRVMNFEQNLTDLEVPQFYRSAVLKEHPEYELNEETVYYFGVDWGNEYCNWYFVAKSHQLSELTKPLGDELTWVN